MKEKSAKYRSKYPDLVKKRRRISMQILRFGQDTDNIIKKLCERCWISEDLGIHHKDGNGLNSIKPNNDISNFETLCRGCHRAHHAFPKTKKYNKLLQNKVYLMPDKSLNFIGNFLKIDKSTVKAIRELNSINHKLNKEHDYHSIKKIKNKNLARAKELLGIKA